MINWPTGSFIRVKSDHISENRAGKDGMVYHDFGDGFVGLTFGFDRYNRFQRVICVGPEIWAKNELELESLDLPTKLTV